VAAATVAPGLIDTNIFVDDARGVADATAFLRSRVAANDLRLSVITAMELVQGCRDASALAQVRRLLRQTIAVPIGDAISERAPDLMDSYFLSHGLLIPDALIAATALEHGLTLYTRNVRDFQMIPSLTRIQPY
jgi:predicted nucleic acid-binding protein